MVLFSAIAPEAARPGPVGLPRQLGEAVQSAESMLGRLPSSDEPCWLVAGRELEDPRRASPSLACPPARPRPQTWKISFLASLASAHMPKGTSQRARRDRSGTPRRRESSRSAWAHRQGRRGSREYSNRHTVFLADWTNQDLNFIKKILPTALGEAGRRCCVSANCHRCCSDR